MKHLTLLILFLLMSIPSIAQKNISVAFLADMKTSSSDLESLKHEVKAVLGNQYRVTFKEPLINHFNLEKARSNYQVLDKKEVQLIIASGSTNAILFYQEQYIKIPTIIIGGINKDLIKLPQTQKQVKKNNVNYIILPNSYTGDLDDFTTVYNFKKVGIIINQNKIENLPIAKVLDAYFSDKATSYQFIPLINNKIDTSLLKNVDAVYISDNYSMSATELNSLINTINKNKLPSFSASGISDVEKGVLVSNKPSSIYNQIFAKIALHSEAIINGENASELPILIEYNNLITVNYSTIKLLGLNLRYSLLGAANIIGTIDKKASKNALSLKVILSKVLKNNLTLQTEKKNIELAEQEVENSNSNYLPDVNATLQGIYIDPEVSQYSTGQNPELETKGDVTLKQLLYSPEASVGIKINKKLSKAQKENYNSAELDVLLNTASAYFNALIMKTNVNIQNQNLQLTKQNLEIAKQNFEAGASGKADVLRFRSQLAQNTQNVIDASNQLKQVYLTINQLMNTPIADEVELKDADISKGLFKDYNYKSLMKLIDSPDILPKLSAFFVDQATTNSPELKNIVFNREAIDLNYNLNKSGRFLPTISLQGQYNIGLSKNGKGATIPVGYPTLPNNTYNAAINISLPIFGKNSRNIKKQTAKIQQEQLEFQKQSLVQNLEKNVQELILDLMSAIANIEISKVSEETAKESLELTQTSYQTGSITVIQLIDAQNNYLQSKLGSATAKYQFLLTSMQLERIMGHFFIMSTPEENLTFFNKANQYINTKNN